MQSFIEKDGAALAHDLIMCLLDGTFCMIPGCFEFSTTFSRMVGARWHHEPDDHEVRGGCHPPKQVRCRIEGMQSFMAKH